MFDGQRAPANAAELFTVFNRLALQGFGGVLAVAQRELVERQGWMSRQAFLSTLATSQVLPGPNIVNLALIVGDRHFGWRGALAALAGLFVVPGILVIALALLYQRFEQWPAVAGALRGMGAVAAGLILATAFKLASGLHGNAIGKPACMAVILATFALVGLLRWPLPWVVLGVGGLALAYAWRCLKP